MFKNTVVAVGHGENELLLEFLRDGAEEAVFSKFVLKAAVGLGDLGGSGARGMHGIIARMDGGDEGHASAQKVGGSGHDEGEMAVLPTTAGGIDGFGVSINLFL